MDSWNARCRSNEQSKEEEMICPYCASKSVRKKGFQGNNQRWRCMSCNKQYQTPIFYDQSALPKILLMDIETSLYHFVGWGTYKQYIDHYRITEHQFILSWAAKWLIDDDVFSDVVTSKEAKKRDDKRICQSIRDILNEADIVIGHNVDRFDLRKLNWRFITHGIAPPSPYKIIDTLKFARKEFFAPSYKQDFLTKYFNKQEKIKTDFQWWIDCEAGDVAALKKMEEYNKQDIRGLEDVYLKIRPYIKNHPNIAVMMDDDVCTHCGSDNIVETEHEYHTGSYSYPVYHCNNCRTSNIRGSKHISHHKTQMRSTT